jgi:hypothetical protein
MIRQRLPNRRASENFSFEHLGSPYIATISGFPNGDLAEIFLSNHRAGSHADACARDSAVVCSIALQFGASSKIISHALLRDPQGQASRPLGTALDLVLNTIPGQRPTG